MAAGRKHKMTVVLHYILITDPTGCARLPGYCLPCKVMYNLLPPYCTTTSSPNVTIASKWSTSCFDLPWRPLLVAPMSCNDGPQVCKRLHLAHMMARGLCTSFPVTQRFSAFWPKNSREKLNILIVGDVKSKDIVLYRDFGILIGLIFSAAIFIISCYLNR